MNRKLRIGSLVLVALVLLGWLGITGLHRSDRLAAWALNTLVAQPGSGLTINSVQGNLSEGLRLAGIRLDTDGLRIDIQRLDARVNIGLFPPAITIEQGDAEGVTVFSKPGNQASAPSPVVLGDLVAPLPLTVRALQVRSVEWRDEEDSILARWDTVDTALNWHQSINIERLEASGPDGVWNVQGDLELDEAGRHRWTVETVDDPSALRLELDGDGSRSQLELTVAEWGGVIQGTVSTLFDVPSFDLEIRLAPQSVPLSDGEELTLEAIEGHLAGTWEEWTVRGSATTSAMGLEGLSTRLEGRGNASVLQVDAFTLAGDKLEANAEGKLSWPLEGPLAFQMELQRLDPGVWVEDWPTAHVLAGSAGISVTQERVLFQPLALRLADTEFALSGELDADLETGRLAGRLDWSALQWPPAPAQSAVSSRGGKATLSGQLDDWSLEAQLHLDSVDYPGGDLLVSARGGATTAELIRLEADALGGRVSGSGHIDWTHHTQIDTEWVLQDVDVRHIAPDWPLRASGGLGVRHDAGTGQLDLALRNISGEMDELPFTANGTLRQVGSQWAFDQVAVVSGGSRIELNGDLQSNAGIRFALSARQPGRLSSLLGGAAEAQGWLAPAAQPPRFELTVDSQQLEWEALRLVGLSVEPAPLNDGEFWALEGRLDSLEWGDTLLDGLQLRLSGDAQGQRLDTRLEQAARALSVSLAGAFDDPDSPLDSGWSGRLLRLDLVDGEEERLALIEPADIALRAGEWLVENACLSASGGGLCLSAKHSQTGQREYRLAADSLPLQVTEWVLSHELDFSQKLNGELSLLVNEDRETQGFADFRVTPGLFGDEEEELMTETGEGRVAFDIQGGNLVSGVVDLPMPGVGDVDMEFSITGLALDGSGKLDGHLKARFDNLEAVETFAPGLDGVDGQLELSFILGGRTGDPSLSGSFDLENGRADYPLMGLALRDINLHGEVDEADFFRADGSFRAGEGTGDLGLLADFSDLSQPTFSVAATGKALKLLDTRDAEAWIDVDLQANWVSPAWQVDGSLHVPRARLSPVTTVLDKVSESSDVVIVAGPSPYGMADESSAPVNLTGSIRTSLGDEVQLITDLAVMDLGGAVTLEWEGQAEPIADGAITLDGDLQVYGPVLRVDRGRVRFPRVPVSNPVLDIRAERDIFGNTAIRAAGVAVTGTARRPDVEAYTRPLTTRDRAWGLLITGSDFDYGQGVGALDVGTYIAPRLYVSYGVSLFDDDNVISARFDLKRGFGIKATSGQRETGLDISYTVDR